MRSVGNKLGAILFFAGVLTLSAAAWSATPRGKVSLSERTERLADLVDTAVPENGRRTLTGLNEDGAVRVQQVDEGYVRNLAAPGKAYFPVRAGGRDAEGVARAFLAAQSDLLLNRTDGVEFVTKRVKTLGAYSFVRMGQRYKGVPVWGAETVVQVFGTRGVSYVASDLMRDTSVLDSGALSTQPSIDAARAIELAVAALADLRKPETLEAETPELVIYEPSVLKMPGESHLVWKMDVVGRDGDNFRYCVLVDAHTEEIVLKFSQERNYLRRDVYDAQNNYFDPTTTFYGVPERFEGGLPSLVTDVNRMYDYLGDSYNFYQNHYGRDSINDKGMTLSTTVRYRFDTGPNAAWDGRRIWAWAGYVCDDVIGHEYTHGITQYESNLIYLSESGALNEAFSDIWGEWIDLTNGRGKDSPAFRWEIGEELPTGAIRSMKDPGKYANTFPEIGIPLPLPDRYNSPYWYYGTGDLYGVHHNMGVGDKLAYLLTDGETFNNYEIKGLGIDTAAQLFWVVQSSLLTEASDYQDLFPALLQAGRYLGLDLQNITRACMAVEIVPSYSMTAFKITYSGCDVEVVDGVSLFVENCTSKASVNIQKISRFPSNVQLTNNSDFIKPGLIYMASETMPLVKVQGSLRRFQTQARIFSLEASGTIDTLVASETNIGSISAAAIRSLSISDQLPGPRTVTSILANGNPVPDAFKTITVNLKGVTLKKLDVPYQSAVINASTRKVQEQGVIVYIARADLGGVNVGDSLTATATGANVVGDMVARGTIKKVAATPITYTREGVSRTYGGFIGDPEGDLLYTNEERVLMSIWDHQVWIAGGEKGWPGQSSSVLVGTVSAPLGILAYVVAGYDQYPEFPTFAGKVGVLSTKTSAAGSQGLWGIMGKNAATTAKLVGDPTAFVSQRIRLYETLQELPPDNDNVAGARAVSGVDGLAYGANVWATAELSEPDHAGLPAFQSVWWRWTAPKDMRVTFTTQGSKFHSVLSVYSGSAPSNLVAVSHLDTSNDEYSAIHFVAESGKSYLICVDGNPGLSDAEVGSRNSRGAGQGMIQLQWKPAVAPGNDNFADATDLGVSAGTLVGTNNLASRETGEPDHAGVHGSASVWYSITLDSASNLVVSTAGSTFDTLLAAYTGTAVNDLTLVPGATSENDNAAAAMLTSEITFTAQAGITYYIAVDGKPGNDMGTVQLTWSARPVNDDFVDALPIQGSAGWAVGSNVNATLEPDELNAALGIASSVWWRFTAPTTSATVPMVFSTQGSSFDTVLLVYTGPSVDRLDLVAINDDVTTMPILLTWSQVSVPMTAGQTYMICVCGLNELEIGSIALSWQTGAAAALQSVEKAANREDLPVYQPQRHNAVGDLQVQNAKLRLWYRAQCLMLSLNKAREGSGALGR
jgi:Zn-dependent metalloprotease